MYLNDSIEIMSEGESKEAMSNEAYVGASIVLGFIGFFGFTLNLAVVIVIVVDRKNLWTPVNVVLLNLVTGNTLVAAFGNPLAMISAIAGKWYWRFEICLWYAWFMSTLGFANIGNLTVMSVERWLLVTRPMEALSIRQAMFLSLCVWIYALTLSLPPFFGWGSYGPEAGNVSCSVSWEVHDPVTRSDTYIAFLFVIGLVLPVIVIVSSYSAIILTLRKVKKRTGSRRRRQDKVTKMVAVMVGTFLLAWTPYAIFALAAQYFYVVLPPSVAIMPALLAKSSICYNPVIYAGLNAQFTRSLKKLFGIRDAAREVAESQTTAMTTIHRQNVKNG